MVVAEVTQPSLGVGYELGRAVALSKQILCLFRPQSGRGKHFQALDGHYLPPQLSKDPAHIFLGGLNTVPIPKKGWGRGQGGGSVGVPSPSFASPVLSAMIRGAADGSKFQVWDYEEGEVEAMLDRYFEADPR